MSILSVLAIMAFCLILTVAGVIIISLPFAWMPDRKTKTEKCCANCARHKSGIITCNGEPVQPDDCCENWREAR